MARQRPGKQLSYDQFLHEVIRYRRMEHPAGPQSKSGRAGWGAVPAIIETVAQIAFAGVVGNASWDGVKWLVARFRERWVTRQNPEAWLETLLTEGKYEEIRIRHHPGTEGRTEVDILYPDQKSELRIVKLMADQAKAYGKSPPRPRKTRLRRRG